MTLHKKSYSVQMSYDVSDTEKQKAEQALWYFKATEKLLMRASDHLNIMKTPFKDNLDMAPEDIVKARAVIRRFRDTAIDFFDEFKKSAFQCINLMQAFASDTQTLKLLKSFISSIDELELKVNNFSGFFSDLESKDFPKNVVTSIEDIQNQCNDIDELIDGRIKNHIQTNILATSWVDSVSNDLQMKIEEKTPLVMDLFNKRQDQLNEAIREKTHIGK